MDLSASFSFILCHLAYYVALSKAGATKNTFATVRTLSNPPEVYNLPRVETSSTLISSCGGLYNSSVGGIFHKPFGVVLPNERCSWIIAVSGAVGYGISVEYLGNQINKADNGQRLLVTGIKRTGGYSPEAIFTPYLPVTTGVFTVSDAHLVIVSFHSLTTDWKNNTGFVLRYNAYRYGNITNLPSNSTNHYFSSPTFEYKYPPLQSQYDYNELAAFLFPMFSSRHTGGANHIWYKRNSMGVGYPSYLYVYTFNVSELPGTGNWQANGRIPYDVETVHISHDDMVLILFLSNSQQRDKGFWLWYTGC